MGGSDILKTLGRGDPLTKEELLYLLENREMVKEDLFALARSSREKHFQNRIFIRGLIEFTNYCKNDCFYCGIRFSNRGLSRYRLDEKDIKDLVKRGKGLGLSTYVLQGGEDPYFSDSILLSWIKSIKEIDPKAAITLSVGERDFSSYQRLREAGVDRFLLRHETINQRHYRLLHPRSMSLERRIQCLKDLSSLGYQVGAGFLVGSPFQKLEYLAEDLVFLQKLQPAMIGIGPFIAHSQTPFAKEKNGDLDLCLFLIGLLRALFPRANIPATTALQTLSYQGRIRAIEAGANVFMPNMSPKTVRKKYALYDNKAAYALEAMENLEELKNTMKSFGYEVDMGRGDFFQ